MAPRFFPESGAQQLYIHTDWSWKTSLKLHVGNMHLPEQASKQMLFNTFRCYY